ncbi:MAG: N-acetyl-gamma-glutamyl-phosphate reductase [Polyangiaceae bacterium]|nr:N-acetyl-gamma-glutamyl-phosphate reductase [Polyangiaceae bacterium]
MTAALKASSTSAQKTLGIVGSRGHVGQELLALIRAHVGFDVRLAVSQRDGITPEQAASHCLDAYVLALPNGAAAPYVAAINVARKDSVIVDLSADYRFDDNWVYGQPERQREEIAGATRIANPGCYATAAELALGPLADMLRWTPPSIFGVSGYSGAGTTPSARNDPEVLRDNLLPYSLTTHVHEREISRQLGCPVFLLPHVAPFFRGIMVTASMFFEAPQRKSVLEDRYRAAYANEPLVVLQKEAPLVRDIAGKHHVTIGGLEVSSDGRHAAIVATIDNLLAGAATQAVRNLNLALGYPENCGVPLPHHAAPL